MALSSNLVFARSNATQTLTRVVSTPTIEATYYAALTNGVYKYTPAPSTANGPGTTGASPFNYVPQALAFNGSGAILGQSTAGKFTAAATGLVFAGFIASAYYPKAELYIDITAEGNQSLLMSLGDVEVDLRLTTAATAAVLNVCKPDRAWKQAGPRVPGHVNRFHYEFTDPLAGATATTNILEVRVSSRNIIEIPTANVVASLLLVGLDAV